MDDLRDAVSFHQLLLAANNRSEVTQQAYLYYECLFLRYLEVHRIAPALSELSTARVREFLLWFRKQPERGRTRDGEVTVRTAAEMLKRLGGVLEQNDYFDVNPLRKLVLPSITKFMRQPFTAAEINAMWGACFRTATPARDEALFLLLLDTGMRIGEACSLRIAKLDLHERQVTVMGKGRRERVIPIGDGDKRGGGRVVRALRRHLDMQDERWAENTPYVFLGRNGQRLQPDGGNGVIKRIAELGGVNDAYPHRLRHTFCTWYLTVYPGDELGLRRIVGHVSKNVLADYVHLAQSTIAERAGRASLSETWLRETGPKVPITNGRGWPITMSGIGLPGGRSERPSRGLPLAENHELGRLPNSPKVSRRFSQ